MLGVRYKFVNFGAKKSRAHLIGEPEYPAKELGFRRLNLLDLRVYNTFSLQQISRRTKVTQVLVLVKKEKMIKYETLLNLLAADLRRAPGSPDAISAMLSAIIDLGYDRSTKTLGYNRSTRTLFKKNTSR